MYYPSLKNEDPIFLKITTEDYEKKELKYKTDNDEYENVLKSFEIDDD